MSSNYCLKEKYSKLPLSGGETGRKTHDETMVLWGIFLLPALVTFGLRKGLDTVSSLDAISDGLLQVFKDVSESHSTPTAVASVQRCVRISQFSHRVARTAASHFLTRRPKLAGKVLS